MRASGFSAPHASRRANCELRILGSPVRFLSLLVWGLIGLAVLALGWAWVKQDARWELFSLAFVGWVSSRTLNPINPTYP